MRSTDLQIIGIPGLPEVAAGSRLDELIAGAVRSHGIGVKQKDIFVVAQKIVSKAEGRLVRLETVDPSPLARSWAEAHGKEATVVEVILGQSRRLVRMDRGILIAETDQGFVCANAGVDASNVPPGSVTLLPEDPDRSAAELRVALERQFRVSLAVIVCDTFGRPWRQGLVNVALGVSGMDPFVDYRGQSDAFGCRLEATLIAAADELASAAELVMGKTAQIPVALVRGFNYPPAEGTGRRMIRPGDEDLFR